MFFAYGRLRKGITAPFVLDFGSCSYCDSITQDREGDQMLSSCPEGGGGSGQAIRDKRGLCPVSFQAQLFKCLFHCSGPLRILFNEIHPLADVVAKIVKRLFMRVGRIAVFLIVPIWHF